jgi:hypothetical protein
MSTTHDSAEVARSAFEARKIKTGNELEQRSQRSVFELDPARRSQSHLHVP